MAKLVRESAIKLSERDIERTCTDLLALDGWRCLKTDPVSRREWGKGFGEKGMADCLYIRYRQNPEDRTETIAHPTGEERGRGIHAGREKVLVTYIPHFYLGCDVLWIEWKKPSGKLHVHQKEWHDSERYRGAVTWIAGVDFPATFDDFLAFYRNSGLNRRPV